MQISVFSCLDKSSVPTHAISLDEALDLIKNNPEQNKITIARSSGKYNKDKPYVGPNGARNLYEHTKSTMIPVVTWNAKIKDRRRKSNIETPSGYIYGDVDDFQEVINKGFASNEEEAKAYVWKVLTNRGFSLNKAVWRSFGGEKSGFGFIMKVEGLTVENFKTTWLALAEEFAQRGIVLDPQTKDITRPNVLSYDPEIFIRPDDEVRPYIAVEEDLSEYTIISGGAVPEGQRRDTLDNLLDKFYNDGELWDHGAKRLTYGFYQKYFSIANIIGVPFEDSFDFLVEKQNDYSSLFSYRSQSKVSYIGRRQYSYYSSEFGRRKIKNSTKESPQNDRVIEDINVAYVGDSAMKLEYIWYNLRYKNSDAEAKLELFATISKSNGILKKDIEVFVAEMLPTDDKNFAIVERVYGNSKVIFGKVSKLTDTAIELRVQKFYQYATDNHRKVIKTDVYGGNVNRKLTEIHNYLTVLNGEITEDNRLDFLCSYFRETKAFAISSQDAQEYISGYYTLSQEESDHLVTRKGNRVANATLRTYRKTIGYAQFLVGEIYAYDAWKFGLRTIECLTEQQVRDRYNIVEEYFLKKGQYISDLDLNIGDNKILHGDTGQGKTTWLCEHMTGLRIALVPIIPLLKGIQETHNASVFFEDMKNVNEGDELIVCTYSSFPKLLKIMERWKTHTVGQYDLYFDEYHNNAVSSDPSYRGYELNYIADNMDLFKSRTMLTGTLFPILHPAFEKFEIIRVNWEHTPPKRYKKVNYVNQYAAVESLLDRDKKNCIYLQSKKDALVDLLTYLAIKGWDEKRIWCINADEKNDPRFERLIKNERVDDDVQILICTSVISEGINIKNDDFTTIHFMSHESVLIKEQVVNRFRKVFAHTEEESNCMIYFYKKQSNERRDEQNHVDVVKVQKKMIELTKKCIEIFARPFSSGDSMSQKIAGKLFFSEIFGKSALFRNKDGNWKPDYLSIANKAYIEEKNYSYQNDEFTQMMLKQYNWVYEGELYHNGELLEQEKEMLQIERETREDELAEDIEEIMDTIRHDGEKKTIEMIDDSQVAKLKEKKRPEHEITLRAKVKSLCDNMEFNDAWNLVKEWTTEHGRSPRVWKTIGRQINTKVALGLKIYENKTDVSTKFAKSLVNVFKKQKEQEVETGEIQLMTMGEVKIAIKTRQKHCPKLGKLTITDSLALEILKQYFDVKEILRGKRIKYHLVGIRGDNDVATSFNMIQAWVEECKANDIALTTQEMLEKINSIRQQLPVLGMTYKVNDKEIMPFKLKKSGDAKRLLGDRYTMVHASHRMVKGKRKNVYKFAMLSAEHLRSVTVKPLRKVSPSEKHVEDMTIEERKRFGLQYKVNSLNYYMSLNGGTGLPF